MKFKNSFFLCLSLVLTFLSFSQLHATTLDTLNQVDKKGRKQGYWIKKEKAPKLSYEGRFLNDMPMGTFVYTDAKGSKVAVSDFFREGYASYTTLFYPNGKKMAEGFYLDKQKDSVWKFYDEAEVLLKIEHYKNNQLNGLALVFDENGEMVEANEWYRGLRHGKWWKKSGNSFQVSTYKLNKTDGLYEVFYLDSTLKLKGWFNDGLKVGDFTYYAPNGDLSKIDVYKENIMVERSVYIKVDGEFVGVGMDSLDLITYQDGLTYLYFNNGKILKSSQDFKYICGLFDTDFFVFANPTYFLSFKAIKALNEENPDGAEVVMKNKYPFFIFADVEGVGVIKSCLDKSEVK